MDMLEGYGDSGNPVGDKSQFIMSLFEQLDRDGIKPVDRSIIDRCVTSGLLPNKENAYTCYVERKIVRTT